MALALGQRILDKFLSAPATRTDGGCVEWCGPRDPGGYGMVNGIRASHIALMLAGRPLPEGMHALHSCDNPPCVNPDHLAAGTRSQNMRDMVARGRHSSISGDSHHRTILSDAQVEEMRDAYQGRRGEIAELAASYGISANQVSLILRGLRRKTAPGKIHSSQWRPGGWKRTATSTAPAETHDAMMRGGRS